MLVRLRHVLFSLVASSLVVTPLLAAPKPRPVANYDVRVAGPAALSNGRAGRTVASPADLRPTALGINRGVAALRAIAPGASARMSTATAAPELVTASRQPLSAAAPGRAGIDVVRDFLRANQAIYRLSDAEIDGLRFLGESTSRGSGLRMVRVDQVVDGVPVFQSETRFILDRDGRIYRSIGTLVPAAEQVADRSARQMRAEDALVAALAPVGIALEASAVRTVADAGAPAWQRLTVANAAVAGEVGAQRGWFPLAPGLLVPAWRHVTFTSGEQDWSTIVDATSGATLWRKGIREHASTEQARFSVYVQADGTTPADSPAPHSPTTATPGQQFPEIARTIVNMFTAQDIVASPDGWIPDGSTTTTGNNVDAYVDANSNNVPDPGTIDLNGRPVGNPDGAALNRDFLGNTVRDFNYTPPPSGGNPNAGDAPTGVPFRRGATTQLFYVSNWYHDKLFALGFDEAAGNFQSTNFSGMGTGADPVLAEVQDAAGNAATSSNRNNANFATPPDGMSGRMQMFIFNFPAPDRDGDLDAEIVMHELSHGTSNRLIGNADGLIWSPGRGMGEGWSDFIALSLLNNTNADNPNASYASGAYATYQLGGLTDNYTYGIRRFPYSTNNSINPLTWADVDDVTADMSGGIPPSPLGFELAGGFEVHNIGEIWAMSLWEVRSRIIADPAGANGDVPTGNQTALQLVIDGLKMTPNNPSFTDARDALILADCATNACANEQRIWDGFADRGLGYGAEVVPGINGFGNLGSGGVGTSSVVPHLDLFGIAVGDAVGGNNNSAVDPGEAIQLTVGLFNPWRAAAKSVPAGTTAVLTTSTPGVTIFDSAATYGALAPQGNAPGDGFLFTVANNATCGDAIHFTLTTTSTLGVSSFDFTVRVGNPSGTGAPVTFTRDTNPDLLIPDGDPQGVADSLVISQDLQIADLDFRVDNLTHTFTGDLTIMLRGPDGFGSDLIWLREILFGGGDGDNFVNTVIDDESTNDLNQSLATDAPFTGNWLPAFNSPVWNLFGDPAIFPDPVGHLSHYNGMSTVGTWTVHAADNFNLDSGSLNSWSLIVTPQAFVCALGTGNPNVSGTKTVSGTFSVGGTVTYTVTLTNNGTLGALDLAGPEFTDTLPAGLTLTMATATSGTASTAGNTVDWNGTLAPIGGSVTITITATINAGTEGQTISNQGLISYDLDNDNDNDPGPPTDDPSTQTANDPTSFTVAGPAGNVTVTGTKSASGTFVEGGTITYTVVLTNSGTLAQPDNAGNELTDTLPATLTLQTANATSGTASMAGNTVSWNGSIPANGTVTITITATINAGTAGQTISNQGTFSYAADGGAANNTSGTTDDPSTAAAGDPTSVIVLGGGAAPTDIPTLSGMAGLLLGLALAGAGLLLIRMRG